MSTTQTIVHGASAQRPPAPPAPAPRPEVERFTDDALVGAYGIRCASVLTHGLDGTPLPFAATWAVVAPGQATDPHRHADREAFLVLHGTGRVVVGARTIELAPRTLVRLPPFERHVVTNTGAEDLVLLSVAWEEARTEVPSRTAASTKPTRVLVTAAPPTPNGDLHLGHLSGPYLAADAYRRFCAMRGLEAVYVTGTDDNQSYVERKAAANGTSCEQVTDVLSACIAETLALADAAPDLFVRPKDFATSVLEELVERLWKDGYLFAKTAPHPCCDACDRVLFEAHIQGRCPHCGAMTGGNGCESCGVPNDSVDLGNAVCTGCGAPPVLRPVERLYFALGRLGERLEAFHRDVEMSPRLRALTDRTRSGLRDFAVSHPARWGASVPLPGLEHQRFLAWFEMVARYLAYAEHAGVRSGHGPRWDRYWKDDAAEVVQCFGFDNAFFYTTFIPAVLMAFDPEIRLPRAFLSNELYRLDGEKFSTSRNHAIWVRDMVREAPVDAIRFYVAATSPAVEATSFSRADFEARTTAELGRVASWLGALHERVSSALGFAPVPGEWRTDHLEFRRRIDVIVEEARASYEAASFSLEGAAGAVVRLATEGARFGRTQSLVGGARPAEDRTALALELLAAKALALIAAPLMPSFAAALHRALGHDAPPAWDDRLEWVPPSQRVGDLASVAAALQERPERVRA
jgi:methionyl-tRNA synthetase